MILVEGSKDVNFYKSIIGKHFPEYLDSVCIFHVGGVKNVQFGVTSQFIMNTEYKNKTFIIIDSDGKTENDIDNKYYKSLSGDYGYIKDREVFYDRFYYTENATCRETLSFDPKVVENYEGLEQFYNEVLYFINSNRLEIESSLETKVSRHELKNEEKEQILLTLYSEGQVEKKFQLLKERVLDKSLIKMFRKEVYEFKNLNDYDVSQQKEMIPELLSKLEAFFGIE